jgi:hypothetical protein
MQVVVCDDDVCISLCRGLARQNSMAAGATRGCQNSFDTICAEI